MLNLCVFSSSFERGAGIRLATGLLVGHCALYHFLLTIRGCGGHIAFSVIPEGVTTFSTYQKIKGG